MYCMRHNFFYLYIIRGADFTKTFFYHFILLVVHTLLCLDFCCFTWLVPQLMWDHAFYVFTLYVGATLRKYFLLFLRRKKLQTCRNPFAILQYMRQAHYEISFLLASQCIWDAACLILLLLLLLCMRIVPCRTLILILLHCM